MERKINWYNYTNIEWYKSKEEFDKGRRSKNDYKNPP